MPVASTGVSGWRLLYPQADGRGVLIGILDSGVDPGIAGLTTTPTGEPKVLDLRDFSGEGAVALNATNDGRWLGTLRELQFGDMPQADINGDGDNGDGFAVEVSRDSAGWRARIDLDSDGSLENERWMRDYLAAREHFTFGPNGTVNAALNIGNRQSAIGNQGGPELVVYLDNSSHGSHVAGIAAAYNLYGFRGLSGVAPGAQILGLKIADNLRGAVSTTGSMVRALEYARDFARQRNMPLVLNMSFGVGNAQPGRAVMDSIIDAFLLANPDVLFTISAGNDGPGTETMGLPATSELAATVGASYPATFAALQFGVEREFLGWWSARGGSSSKPDFVTPGVAYSAVPAWKTGDEVSGGTSMASPVGAGLGALLISAARADNRTVSAADVLQALRVASVPIDGQPFIDQGAGLPDVRRAWTWLRGRMSGSADRGIQRLRIEAMPAARTQQVASAQRRRLPQGAMRRDGLATPGDTIQSFRVSAIGAQSAGTIYRLTSDAPWLRPSQPTIAMGATGSMVIEARYDASQLTAPGRYTGTIRGVVDNDTAGGVVFHLANTVIVAQEPAVSLTRQSLRGGQAARWYIRVPANAPGLILRASVPDTSMNSNLSLYEPGGRPARHAKAKDIGGDSSRVVLVVDPEDCVPGVWEVVFQAMPGGTVTYDLSIELAPAAGATTATEWIGADTSFTAPLGADAWRKPFAVPSWATEMVVEVEVTPETWNELTDFAVTMFDAGGVRIGNGAMNYPYHQVRTKLPENRVADFTATLDLFPAFARVVPPPGHQARVRVRFEGAPQPAAGAVPAGWRSVSRMQSWTGPDRRTAITRLVATP